MPSCTGQGHLINEIQQVSVLAETKQDQRLRLNIKGSYTELMGPLTSQLIASQPSHFERCLLLHAMETP